MKNWRTPILGLALCANNALAAPQVVDKVIAVVDNGVVLESDINTLLDLVKRNTHDANQQLPDDATLRRQILDQLIMDNIILQLAQHSNVTLSDDQLDQAISNIATQNHMTLDQLRRHVTYNGMDYNTYRAQIRKEMLMAEVRNREVRRRITILPQEVESLAKQIGSQIGNGVEFNLSHILIKIPKNQTKHQVDKAEILAKSLINKSKNGVDFGKLAMIYSADAHALKDSRMGWAKLEELPTFFAEHLQNAEKNSIIGPIRSGVGFHILKVNDIRNGDQKDRAYRLLFNRKFTEKAQTWMQEQRASTYVKILDNNGQ